MQPYEDKNPGGFFRVTVDVNSEVHGMLQKLIKLKKTSQSNVLRKSINLMYSLQQRVNNGDKIIAFDKEGKKSGDIKF